MAFEREAKSWLDTKPYTLRTDRRGQTDEYVVRFDQAPVVPWRLNCLIGDVVHNLRAALDHLVYRIAVIESRLDPPPKHARLAFPIALTVEEFERKANNCRGDLSDAIWAGLKDQQPFSTHAADPRRSYLWLLEELDIVDRHREFSLMVAALSGSHVAPTGSGLSLIAFGPRRLIKDNADLVLYRSANPDVGVNVVPALEIAFDARHPFSGGQSVRVIIEGLIESTELAIGSWHFQGTT